MAKGSVRKKGKKWYYRFYIEDESGNLVQREFVGTESKSETEALLRKAMEDYEEKKFVAKSENATVGMLLDMWVEEELKPGSLSNGTVMAYQGTVNRITTADQVCLRYKADVILHFLIVFIHVPAVDGHLCLRGLISVHRVDQRCLSCTGRYNGKGT